jgi:hypothetical protein
VAGLALVALMIEFARVSTASGASSGAPLRTAVHLEPDTTTKTRPHPVDSPSFARAQALDAQQGQSDASKAEQAACDRWGCSCQGFSNHYGTGNGKWGRALNNWRGPPRDLELNRQWWRDQHCETTPEPTALPTIGGAALDDGPQPALGDRAIEALPKLAAPFHVGPGGRAAARLMSDQPGNCSTDPTTVTCTCQGISDLHRTTEYGMGTAGPLEVSFWRANGCDTTPRITLQLSDSDRQKFSILARRRHEQKSTARGTRLASDVVGGRKPGVLQLADTCVRLFGGPHAQAITLMMPDDAQAGLHTDDLQYRGYGDPILGEQATPNVTVDHPVVLLNLDHYYGGNPQHCWSDVVVPVLLGLGLGPGGASSLPLADGVPPAAANYFMPYRAQKIQSLYCARLMRRLNIITADPVDALASIDRTPEATWMCAPVLMIPRRWRYRKPPDIDAKWEAHSNAQRWEAPGRHYIRDDPLRASADSLWKPETGGPFWRWLHSLARKQIRCNEGEGRSGTEFSPAVTAAINSGTGIVLLYDRHDTQHRRLANADAVKTELDDFYGGSGLQVVRVSSLEGYSVCEQAMLFSVAQVAVFPHGGHTTNVIYMPPGAQVVELFCGAAHDTPPMQSSYYANLMGIQYAFVRDLQAMCANNREGFRWLANYTAPLGLVTQTLQQLQNQATQTASIEKTRAGVRQVTTPAD